jgi:asparagine synthase (glutamine-hydrolysing)
MWAFAIWDDCHKSLFLSRDRFGVKPLHYYHDNSRFAFASEMKAFLACDYFDIVPDEGVISTALSGFCSIESTKKCIYKNINRLQPGHYLTISSQGKLIIKRWWNTLDHLSTPPDNYDDKVERFREIFLDACKIRMRSDVPIATALSGGLDSSAVLGGLYAAQKDNKLTNEMSCQRAFVASYPGTRQDETMYATKMANSCGIDYELLNTYSSELPYFIEKSIISLEEIYDIVVDPWLLYRKMKSSGYSVSLDGHGGDELLGGYHMYLDMYMKECVESKKTHLLKELVSTKKNMFLTAGTGVSQNISSLNELSKLKLPSYLDYHHYYFDPTFDRRGLPILAKPTPLLYDTYLDDQEKLKDLNFGHLNRKLYFDFHVGTLPTILRNFDRCSMAHGVEIRAPLMDWRLVSYCFNLNNTDKIGNGYSKRILRDAVNGVVVDEIRKRKTKIGFVSPLDNWLLGSLKEYLLDNISSKLFLESNIWNGKLIRALVLQALDQNDGSTLRKMWKFLQAHILLTRK